MFYIESNNLIIRPLTEADAADILEFKSDAEVMKYMDSPLQTSLADAIKYVNEKGEGFIRAGVYHKASSKIVGRIDVFAIYKKHAFASIGYDLNKNYWGQGIMTEALSLLIDYCFKELKLNRIEAQAHQHNYASHRVLEKLNFKREAVLKENFLIDGVFWDSYLYSLLGRESLVIKRDA